MGFVLRVTEGAGEGEEFSFEGGEVRLGRTADNDVVIKDPSSSRSHCRIFEKGGLRYVEDLKSANGTIVNDEPLSTPHALASGDRILVGDVVMVYETDDVDPNSTLLKPPDSTVDEAEDEDPNATLLKPPSAPPPTARRATGTGASKALSRPSRAIKRAPEPEPEPEPEEDVADVEDEAANTGDLDDDGGEPPVEDEVDEEVSGNSTKNFEVPPPRALAERRGTSGSRAPVRAGRPAAAPLSAADRARQRRELSQSASGKLLLMWLDLPTAARIVVSILGGLFTLGFMALVITAVMPRRVAKKAEPVELVPNANPIAESFGAGETVDFPRPDMKAFTFQAASPTRIVGVVHYQAKDISKDEVSIELNGVQLGSVPPDSLDVDQRELDVVLPAASVKPRESNSLVFDNVTNPPGDDPWRIWNLWVEIIPVPEMSTDEATRQAKEQVDKASKFYEQRNVGADNLFRSWKTYREAWLLLESTPDRPDELLQIARTRMREIRPELDAKCSAMLVGYKQAITQKNQDLEKARRVLEGIPSHFPTKEHACYNISRVLLADLDDLGEMPSQ